MKVTGVVLAGGKSARMGKDKSLLLYNNKPLIKRVVEELQPIVDDLIIVSNTVKYGFLSVKEISDIFPKMGPLGGIHAGLKTSENEYCFVTACDIPFFSGDLAEFLLDQKRGFDVVIPQINEYLQPLYAVYSKACLPYIEECLKLNIKKITAFFPKVKIKYIDYNQIRKIIEPEKVFLNINTPKDYENLQHLNGRE
jgi:molybdopterin-guanine dinucleotide biosynthesis protein A